MTSPYLSLPRRTVAEAQADRSRHPSEVRKLDAERLANPERVAVHIANATPAPEIEPRLSPIWLILWCLTLWAIVLTCGYVVLSE